MTTKDVASRGTKRIRPDTTDDTSDDFLEEERLKKHPKNDDAMDALDIAIAQEVANDIQSSKVKKATKAEMTSWSQRTRLNYRAGIHPNDPKANVKIRALRKALACHLMVKRGMVFDGKKNLSKFSIEESYLAVRSVHKEFGAVYKWDKDLCEEFINAFLEDRHHNLLRGDRKKRLEAATEGQKARLDPLLQGKSKETNEMILAAIKPNAKAMAQRKAAGKSATKNKRGLSPVVQSSMKKWGKEVHVEKTNGTARKPKSSGSKTTVGGELGPDELTVHIHHGATVKVKKLNSFVRFVGQLSPHLIVGEDDSIWYRTVNHMIWRAVLIDKDLKNIYEVASDAGNHITVSLMTKVITLPLLLLSTF